MWPGHGFNRMAVIKAAIGMAEDTMGLNHGFLIQFRYYPRILSDILGYSQPPQYKTACFFRYGISRKEGDPHAT